MARRQSNAGSIGPFYEDLQPNAEIKEEEGAHLLHIHLPDFAREQIRVIFIDSTRTVRVQGERPLGNNKWSRFNRTFPVPQNCSVEKISGRFREGILTITIPKQTIMPPQPAVPPKQEGKKITPKEKEPSSAPAPPPVTMPPPKEPSPVAAPPPKVPSSAVAPPPKEPSPAVAPPPKEPSPVVAPPPKVPTPAAAPPPKVPSSAVAPPPKEPSPAVAPPPKEPSPVVAPLPPPPPPPPKVPSSVGAPPLKPVAPAQLPQGETKGKEQESSPAFQTPQKPIIEPKRLKGQEQGEKVKEKEETDFKQKATKMKNVVVETMRTALEKKEGRPLIVNMGVAVLVIVAVGAYVTYKMRSSAKPKD